jgi:c(7)-type cytochrome triheme protein
MSGILLIRTLLIAWGLTLLLTHLALGDALPLPPLPPAHHYGQVTFSKYTARSGRKPVVFSHWLHRRQFTCSVCHTDLGFALKAGATDITEADNRAGRYCGACHNVRISFTVRGNCKKCHSGDSDFSRAKFKELASLPRRGVANGIDWLRAEDEQLITPRSRHPEKMPFAKDIPLQPAAKTVAPVTFSHRTHGRQVACDSCHPEPFSFKPQRTKAFTMQEMLAGGACGICHLRVAFPLHECTRCHTPPPATATIGPERS